MKTTLRTDITVKQICDGFVYNEAEGRGLFCCPKPCVRRPMPLWSEKFIIMTLSIFRDVF